MVCPLFNVDLILITCENIVLSLLTSPSPHSTPSYLQTWWPPQTACAYLYHNILKFSLQLYHKQFERMAMFHSFLNFKSLACCLVQYTIISELNILLYSKNICFHLTIFNDQSKMSIYLFRILISRQESLDWRYFGWSFF